jgi:hypothetical protein
VAQAEKCLENVRAALTAADTSLDDVVRVRYLFADRADFAPCWPALQRYLGRTRPADTMLVAGLMEPAMKVAIEVTARRGSRVDTQLRAARARGLLGAFPVHSAGEGCHRDIEGFCWVPHGELWVSLNRLDCKKDLRFFFTESTLSMVEK